MADLESINNMLQDIGGFKITPDPTTGNQIKYQSSGGITAIGR